MAPQKLLFFLFCKTVGVPYRYQNTEYFSFISETIRSFFVNLWHKIWVSQTVSKFEITLEYTIKMHMHIYMCYKDDIIKNTNIISLK